MRRIILLLLLVGLVIVPRVDAAKRRTKVTRCAIAHFFRNVGAEMVFTIIEFNNGDLTGTVRIDRITIRNSFGDVVWDSGPAIGVSHPLNTDYTPPLDITSVPNGATYYLPTTAIWGLFAVNTNQEGFHMSVTVQWSTLGSTSKFKIMAERTARVRIDNGNGTFSQRGETSRKNGQCFKGQKEP